VPMPSSDVGVGNRASFSTGIIDDVHAQTDKAVKTAKRKLNLLIFHLFLIVVVSVIELQRTQHQFIQRFKVIWANGGK
jgi:hypothetical protein